MAAILIVPTRLDNPFPQKGEWSIKDERTLLQSHTSGSYTKHCATWSLARCVLKLPLSSAGSVSQEQFQLLSGQ